MDDMGKIQAIDWDKFDWEPCNKAVAAIVKQALPHKQESDSFSEGSNTTEFIKCAGEWPEDATVGQVLDSPWRTEPTYMSGYGLTAISHYRQAYKECEECLRDGIEALIGGFDGRDSDVCDFMHEQVTGLLDEVAPENAYEFSGHNEANQQER